MRLLLRERRGGEGLALEPRCREDCKQHNCAFQHETVIQRYDRVGIGKCYNQYECSFWFIQQNEKLFYYYCLFDKKRRLFRSVNYKSYVGLHINQTD